MIAAMDTSGIIIHKIYTGYLNGELYLAFLRDLKMRVGRRKIAILYDGLSVHKLKAASELMDSYKWIPILNIAYSPENNAIEFYWQMLKRKYREQMMLNFVIIDGKPQDLQQRLMDILNGLMDRFGNYDTTEMIEVSIRNIEKALGMNLDELTV